MEEAIKKFLNYNEEKEVSSLTKRSQSLETFWHDKSFSIHPMDREDYPTRVKEEVKPPDRSPTPTHIIVQEIILFRLDEPMEKDEMKKKLLESFEGVEKVDIEILSVSFGIFQETEFHFLIQALKKASENKCKIKICLANPETDTWRKLQPSPAKCGDLVKKAKWIKAEIPSSEIFFVDIPIYCSIYRVADEILMVTHLYKKSSMESPWSWITSKSQPQSFHLYVDQFRTCLKEAQSF